MECSQHCPQCTDLCNVANTLFILIGHILFGIIYVVPEGSTYAKNYSFDNISYLIAELSSHHNVNKVCLVGDFNARTGTKDDVIINNEVIDAIDIPDFAKIDLCTRGNDLCPTRASNDHKSNNYGKDLLNLCNMCDLRIVNGRLGLSSARATCRDASVVDYCLVSSSVFECVKSFNVRSFDPLFSDVHNVIEMCVQEMFPVIVHDGSAPPQECNGVMISHRYRWSKDDENAFVNNINNDVLHELSQKLDGLMCDATNVDGDSIDDLYSIICGLFEQAAIECNMKKECKSDDGTKRNHGRTKQKWFNSECKEKRKEYHKQKQVYRRCKSDFNLTLLREKSKLYKKALNRAIGVYENNFNEKLRSLKTSNPKEFWKLLCDKNKVTDSKVDIDVFANFFTNLNIDNNTYDCNDKERARDKGALENDFLNELFSEDEVMCVLKNLKCGKAAGPDLLINEFFRSSRLLICPLFTKLFNVILCSGKLPTAWSDSLMVPIYKNKGSKTDPNNYRGISLINCFCKVFTSLLSNRITRYCDSIQLLGCEQAGFRKHFSTCDHLFSLYALIWMYNKIIKKKLYSCFVDYSKAFDTVPRLHLWYKLLSQGINGKILNVIKVLYGMAKSAVKLNNRHSPFFNCEIGVRQGDNLSPLLFALYLNDLQEHLAKAYNGLSESCALIQDVVQDEDTVVYLKLFTILYADDTVIFAESRHELQAALHGMHHYCNNWKLRINTDKTKVVVFGARPGKHENDLMLGDQTIKVISEYTYLGILFPSNCNLSKSVNIVKSQANRAMFALVKKARKLNLAVDVQLQLFDSMVLPIALYGCELWGFKNIDVVEKMHLQFCKMMLKVKNSTNNNMVLGELGRLPLAYNVDCRMLGFWYKLITGQQNKISCILYKALFNLDAQFQFKNDWLNKIRTILCNCGLDEYWFDPVKVHTLSYVNFKSLYKKKLYEMYHARWKSSIDSSSKCFLYKNFKTELVLEKYLTILNEPSKSKLSKFRCSNHNLPIEVGRHNDVARNDRRCNICTLNDLGDEYHYIAVCPNFVNQRKMYLPGSFVKKPSVLKFCDLLQSGNKVVLFKMAKFVGIICKQFARKVT